MQELITQIVSHPYAVYGLIVILSIIEGPILSIILGAIWKLGYVHFLPAYIALMAGDVIGDTAFYFIGYHYGHRFIRRFGRYLSITEPAVEKVTEIFHRHDAKILIISKLTNGLGFSIVTLITAGIVRIPYWRFLTMNLIGQVVWTGLLMVVGYYFGTAYTAIDSVIGKISLVVGAILLILAVNGYRKFLATKIS
jgi:membrane protein DedA with SNARE-associated domain